MFEINISDRFAASHQLRRPDGSYESLHRHDWHVQITYTGEKLDESGLLVDFTVVRARLREVLAGLDGRQLNDLPTFADRNPSAENVAVHIADQLAAAPLVAPGPGSPRLFAVAVEEEPGCVARYLPTREVRGTP
jgi:6-pyruvoyltetrahydropterin/6-carboxytetrahydropterin synthase